MKVQIAVILALLVATGRAFAENAPAGDPALGEKVFAKSKACHQIGETAHNSVGPELKG